MKVNNKMILIKFEIMHKINIKLEINKYQIEEQQN